MVRLLARIGQVTVVTRSNNKTAIEQGLVDCPELSDVRFVYVDLPRWAAWWKRGTRGVRVYYMLWQVLALAKAKRMHRETNFDLSWHVTMANAWMGSLGSLVGPPFVYGPVGAGVGTPPAAIRALGIKGLFYEGVRDLIRLVGRYANPIARIAWAQAALILCQNSETAQWLPKRHRRRTVVYSNAIIDSEFCPRSRDRDQTALFAARLLPWKGGEFVIRALAKLPTWRLIVCGEGPDRGRLQSLAERLGCWDRVEWRGWVVREEVARIMREDADVFLLPSLHDEGSAAVVEAMFSGLPVVCLDHGGPALLTGQAGVRINASHSAEGIVDAIRTALTTPLPTEAAIEAQCRSLSFESRLAELRRILSDFELLHRDEEAFDEH